MKPLFFLLIFSSLYADIELADRYFAAAEYSTALKLYTELGIRQGMARCHLFLDEPAQALTLLEGSQEHYLMGLAALKLGRIEEALSHFLQHPNREEALQYIGICYFEKGEYEKAKPLAPPFYLARIYLAEGNTTLAEEILGSLPPYSREYNYLLGKLRCKQGRYEEAIPCFRHFPYDLAWAHFNARHLDQAIALFESLLPSENASLALAHCYLLMGEEEKAQKLLGNDLCMPYLTQDQTLYLTGLLHFKNGNRQEALKAFASLSEHSPLLPEALYWSGRAQDDPKPLFTRVFQEFPSSKYAAEAYFYLYPYREYMQGSREAVKHLQNFPEKFPRHPLAINALYLLGIDCTRDRKTPEGKWIRKKSYREAINNFEKVEKKCAELNTFPPLYYQSILEKGLAYGALAKTAQGAKREINLQFAEETFRHLLKEPIPLELKEQAAYSLAATLIEAHKEAEGVLNSLLEFASGYYLSKGWYEKGRLKALKADWREALGCFENAQESACGLSADERLSLLIEESECYKMLNMLDQAMLVLSQVINDDAISALRLKAMFLRSEIYEKQGRFELARKQLEAAAPKGGEWGARALAKLEKEYGL